MAVVQEMNFERLLYNKILEVVETETGPISHSNIVQIIVYLTKIVETYTCIRKEGKRNLILLVLFRYVTDTVTNETSKNELKKIIEFTAMHIIDTIVAVDKREIIIRKKKFLNIF